MDRIAAAFRGGRIYDWPVERHWMKRWPLYRDGLLAAAVCVATVLWSLRSGIGGDALLHPYPAVGGILGMVALELVLLRFSDVTRLVWERPAVQTLAVTSTLGVGVVAVSMGFTWVVAVLVWGLVAYIALVGVVVALGRNPLGRLIG